MGYGFGGFLTVVGLVLAFAVQDNVNEVDLTMIGYILAGVGIVMMVLTFFTLNSSRRKKTEAVTTHRDGTQTVHEQQTNI